MTRRPGLVAGTAALAFLLVAISVVSYRWVTSSRPVSAASAVQRYRSEVPRAEHGPTVSGVAPPSAPAPTKAARATAPRPASVTPPRASSPSVSPVAWWHIPPSGVYTYDTTGYEQATVSRSYPPQSQRIVDTTNGRFDNHHIFSQEHEEWFSLRATSAGGVMLRRRIRVTFGPVTVDDTVVFDPPLLGVPIPYRLGQTWRGSWKGDTYGTYTGKTVDHRTIHVAGRSIEVWKEQLEVVAHGRLTGTVDTTLWWAPKLGLDVREDGTYDVRERGVPGTYHTQYTITLASTRPQQ